MTDLELVENDAEGMFWYEPVGDPVKPCSTASSKRIVSADKKHWIEIALVDENGNPVAGQAYKVRLPNGQEFIGTLDSRGQARIDGIDPGTCKVSFPDLDERSWNRFSNRAVGS
ncbi:MAG: hypothetical protein ABJF23_23280 [Bryobacteraceae bacterium]